jgi:hypothetical protein
VEAGRRRADLSSMRKLLLVVALVVLAVPATAPAKGSGGGHKNAAKECKALRAQMGAEAFRTAFGRKAGKNAFGRCVSTQRKARKAARKRARKACRSEGLRGQAMKRCVRNKISAEPAPKPADYEDAVKECQADQAEDPEDFAAEYGDGPNALAKCVAHEVSDDDDGTETDEPETGDDEGAVEPGSDGPEDSPDDEPDPDEL